MRRRRTPDERYKFSVRKQEKTLEEFAALEIEKADDLLSWYRIKNTEIPDDEYRAVAFLNNREFLRKPGSLTLVYSVYQRCLRELPGPTRETAVDLLRFRFKMYAVALAKGGYN